MDYQLTGPISAYPDGYHGDPYFGDPSPGLDQRWIDHLRCKMTPIIIQTMLTVSIDATIRLYPEEFSHYNQSGILLGDGSGYLATPTAYHDLHCIRFLHKSIYADFYWPEDSEQKRLGRDAHASRPLPPFPNPFWPN